jgi:hypothetical protein
LAIASIINSSISIITFILGVHHKDAITSYFRAACTSFMKNI